MGKHSKRRYKKAHIFTLLNSVPSFVPILILPVLQHLLYNPTSIPALIANYGLSVLFAILVLVGLILEYKSIKYIEKDKSVYTKKGFFHKKRADIPYNCIQSVYIEKNISYRIFGGARRYIINTPGSFSSKGSYSIFLRKRNSVDLTQEIFKKKSGGFIYHGGSLRIILMAIAWSNSFTGLLVAVPTLFELSKISAQYLEQFLSRSSDLTNYIMKIGIPPAVSGLATLMIIGWGFTFLVQLWRYSFFTAYISKSIIHIKRGFISRCEFITSTEKINAIQIKQSILMMILNLKSAYINTIGSGVQKGDKSLMIPADREETINRILGIITTLPKSEDYTVKPQKTEFLGYLWFPIYSIAGTIFTMVLLNHFGYFGEIVKIPLFVLLFVFIYWLFFRMNAHRKSQITICDKAVKIDYFQRMNLTRTYIPYDKIQYVKVYQSPFQRLYKTANVKVYIYSNKSKFYKIKYLKYDKTMEAVDLIESKMKYYDWEN